MFEKNTIRHIQEAVRMGILVQPFRAYAVDRLLGIDWGGNFLAKHAIGNGYTTEHFVRVSRGLYELKDRAPLPPVTAKFIRSLVGCAKGEASMIEAREREHRRDDY
jgi:hypothetical protein